MKRIIGLMALAFAFSVTAPAFAQDKKEGTKMEKKTAKKSGAKKASKKKMDKK